MIFYHFTCHDYLPAIREEGLTRGEIPLGPREVINGVVWLTTDPNPSGHGLSDAKVLTDDECRFFGIPPGTGRFADKRAVRITVVLPMAKVKPWLPWARKRLDSKWLATLSTAGGGSRKARTWYLSFDPIPPSAFRAIDILRPDSNDE